jgi:hypothetical protein
MELKKPGHTRPKAVAAQRWDVLKSGLLLALIMGCAYAVSLRKKPPTSAASATLSQPAGSNLQRSSSPAADVPPASVKEDLATCYRALRAADVAFESASNEGAWLIKLTGPIAGVRIHGGGHADAPTNYLDCRLAQTLLRWAPRLRAQAVVGIGHYSMYRREAVVGSSNKPSGHASGLAIDVGTIELRDGRELSVLKDWANRARGGDPCGTWPDDADGRLLRQLVCDAVARQLFQTVVTPHYNDAHGNHVHLEIDPQRASLWIH